MSENIITKAGRELMENTAYNKQQMLDSQSQKIKTTLDEIEQFKKLAHVVPDNPHNVIVLMNIIESAIKVCGGEPRAEFQDVTHSFIKVFTRLPMKAYLFPFLEPDNPQNKKFHKAITELLIEVPGITGVRWIPTDDGSFIICTIKE